MEAGSASEPEAPAESSQQRAARDARNEARRSARRLAREAHTAVLGCLCFVRVAFCVADETMFNASSLLLSSPRGKLHWMSRHLRVGFRYLVVLKACQFIPIWQLVILKAALFHSSNNKERCMPSPQI